MTWSSTNDLDGFFMEAKRGVVKNCKRTFGNCSKIAIKRQNDKKIIGQMTAKFNAHFMKLSPLFSENYYSAKTYIFVVSTIYHIEKLICKKYPNSLFNLKSIFVLT